MQTSAILGFHIATFQHSPIPKFLKTKDKGQISSHCTVNLATRFPFS